MGGRTAIWAQSVDGIIGDGTDMPWHLPEDLAHFKKHTHGHTVVMGRRTWDSLPDAYKPLPGRDNIIVSTRPAGDWSTGATVIDNLDDIGDDAIIIGGGALYAATLDSVDTVILTEINTRLADALGARAVHAPSLEEFTRTTCGEWHSSKNGYIKQGDTQHPVSYRFSRYERK